MAEDSRSGEGLQIWLDRLQLVSMQRRLSWFGHAARRPKGELIKDLLFPTPPRTWRRRTGGQLKTCATTIKTDRLSWVTHDGVKASTELAQGHRAWSTSVRDVINYIREADTTR